MFQNSGSFIFVQPSHRNDAIKSSRTQQGGVQLADVIGGADEEYMVPLALEQGNLFEKFVGDGFVQPTGLVAIARELFKFIDKNDGFLKGASLFHDLAQIGPRLFDAVNHKQLGAISMNHQERAPAMALAK